MENKAMTELQLKSGQIVEIRNRLWRVDSIYKNEILVSSIDSINNIQRRFYIPYEKIQQATIDLPPADRIGELSKQQLLVNAYRISLIHGTSPFLSLQRSSVVPTNFQLVPVVMALSFPRVRLLVADDVGLGKTIEAGLIMNELIARQIVRKILVICPASLREQWQETLFNFFKLEFKIISSLHKKYLEKGLPIGLSPWDYFQRLITSVDYAKSKTNLNEVLSYEWDLVIVDEAHSCARPHLASATQSVTMQRFELIREISKKSKHLLLLTATPHNGYTDSFTSLIEFLDIQATNAKDLDFIDKNKARKHVCQRTRADVVRWLEEEGGGFNPFPERDKKEIHVESLTKTEANVYQRLQQYSKEIMRLLSASNLKNIAQFTVLHFLKRSLSSPRALKISLRNRIEKLKLGLEDAEIHAEEIKSVLVESDNLENISTEEAHQRIERTTFGRSVSELEIKLLEEIYGEVNKIQPQSDSKYTKLVKEVISELFGYNNKIIIFTRYKDTLEYLQNNLEKDFTLAKILNIYGDMKSEQRKEKFIEFEKAEKAILIATDCISEGMNLQYLCSQVIHYELPWNPNRLEQRSGRVDRFGQPEKIVHIRTIIVDGTLDIDILERIIEKADRIKAEFGFSPPFFNDENDILRRLAQVGRTPRTRRRGEDPNQLTLFEEFFSAPPAQPETDSQEEDKEDRAMIEKIKNDSFYGQTDISLPDIERKLRQTEQTIGSREEIEKFVISSLKLFNCTADKINEDIYKLVLSDDRLMLHGRSNVLEEVTFNKNYAVRNPATELIDLSHPLVSRLVQIIKQQTHIEQELYGRAAYKISSAITKPIAILKILVRFVVETQPSSLLETIITLGFQIYENKALSEQDVEQFEQSQPQRGNRTLAECKEDLKEVFTNQFWQESLNPLIEKYKQQIIQERQSLVTSLNQKELPAWLRGITNVSYVSHDVITITLGYPV